MNIDISKLPLNFRIEVTKEDLIAFAKAISENAKPSVAEEKEAADDIIDFNGALKLTGYAAPTLYAKTAKGEIPHFKKGRKLFFRKSELIEWIETGRRKTQEDINELAERYLKQSKR